MSILFSLLITSFCIIRSDKSIILSPFEKQLKKVETQNKQYLSLKNELERNYSFEKYNAELESFYELYNEEKLLKNSIGTLQTLKHSSMLKIINAIALSSITPYLKKELGLLLHKQFGKKILSHDATRTLLNKLLLYDDRAHEQAWIETMIT